MGSRSFVGSGPCGSTGDGHAARLLRPKQGATSREHCDVRLVEDEEVLLHAAALRRLPCRAESASDRRGARESTSPSTGDQIRLQLQLQQGHSTTHAGCLRTTGVGSRHSNVARALRQRASHSCICSLVLSLFPDRSERANCGTKRVQDGSGRSGVLVRQTQGILVPLQGL